MLFAFANVAGLNLSLGALASQVFFALTHTACLGRVPFLRFPRLAGTGKHREIVQLHQGIVLSGKGQPGLGKERMVSEKSWEAADAREREREKKRERTQKKREGGDKKERTGTC
jgi:hypothetical protein